MLTMMIGLNKDLSSDKFFDVKFINSVFPLVENVDYCGSCYYKLNMSKKKVIKFVDAMVLEAKKSINIETVDYVEVLIGEEIFNANLEIIDGYIFKEKHLLNPIPKDMIHNTNNTTHESTSWKIEDNNAYGFADLLNDNEMQYGNTYNNGIKENLRVTSNVPFTVLFFNEALTPSKSSDITIPKEDFVMVNVVNYGRNGYVLNLLTDYYLVSFKPRKTFEELRGIADNIEESFADPERVVINVLFNEEK